MHLRNLLCFTVEESRHFVTDMKTAFRSEAATVCLFIIRYTYLHCAVIYFCQNTINTSTIINKTPQYQNWSVLRSSLFIYFLAADITDVVNKSD
jgi:hypothetical protein